MRIYGSIQVRFWENADVQKLSDKAKLLAIYLLTGPHSNMLGCLRLPEGYIKEDLRWESHDVKNAFLELININFLTRDDHTHWIVIHEFLNWNPIQNPRQGMGIKKLFELVPTTSTVYKPLVKGLLTHGKYLDKGLTDSLERVSGDCVADKDKNQDKDKDQNQDQDKIIMSGTPDVIPLFDKHHNELTKSQAIEVLNFLNAKTGRAYRPVEENLKLIMARLKSGASVMDCRQVIVKKTREWKADVKMSEYLRPATLFNATKFEQYMGELVLPPEEELEHGVA
jgi:uncharacterized phage protein (TIGR02220 family)